MNISQNGIELIKKFEGCRLEAYKCPAGILTIGYGHTGSEVHLGQKITQEQAEKYLKQDITIHSNNVSRLVKAPLNQNQFDALVVDRSQPFRGYDTVAPAFVSLF